MIRNALRKTYTIMYLLLFLWIILQAAIVSYSRVGIALIFTIPLLALVWFGIFRCIAAKERSPKWFFWAWIILHILSCIVTAVFMYVLEMKLHWDWKEIISTAYTYVTEGYFPDDKYVYYARYPNNKFWLSCMIIFFKVIHRIVPVLSKRAMKWASMVMTATLAQISLTLIYQTARMWMREIHAFFTGCIAIFFLPFYLYAGYSYTDTPSMFLSALILFLSSVLIKKKMKKWQQILCLVLLGMVLAFGFRLKVLVVIQAIALLIELFLSGSGKNALVKKLLAVALVLVCFVPSYLLCEKVANHYMVVTDELSDRYELPLTHWIMMGLHGRGGYEASLLAYSESFPSYAEKKEGIARKMNEMMQEMGSGGFLKHIFVDKLRFTWADSTMRGDWFGTRKPRRQGMLWNIMDLEGKNHKVAWEYTCPYWMLVLIGMALSGWYALTKKPDPDSDSPDLFAIGRLALLGLFLFLSIWEANARYAFCLMPVMIFVSGQGWGEAWQALIAPRLEK